MPVNDHLFSALEALGSLLAARGQSFACVVAGGASLAALGVLDRVTGDVDVMAVRDDDGSLTLAPAEFPSEFAQRLDWRRFGALHVGFVGRLDLIALKLEAASDDPPRGRTDVHVADLAALEATSEELDDAARWVDRVNVDPRRADSIQWVKQHVADRRRR